MTENFMEKFGKIRSSPETWFNIIESDSRKNNRNQLIEDRRLEIGDRKLKVADRVRIVSTLFWSASAC